MTTLNPIPARAVLQRIAFHSKPFAGLPVVRTFPHPAPTWALRAKDGEPADLELLTLSVSPKDDPSARTELHAWVVDSASPETPPITVILNGAQVVWRPGRASILATPEKLDSLWNALIEFAHYAGELRQLESEIEIGWPELEADTPLANDVTLADLANREGYGQRMDRTLKRRIRFARMETALYHPTPSLGAAGVELGQRLREKANLESRMETCDGHLEIYEYVYEMGSQRMGEFQAARKEQKLEWLIIVLLAIEVVILILELLWKLEV